MGLFTSLAKRRITEKNLLASVSKSVRSIDAEEDELHRAENRDRNASSMGLEPIGDDSYFAHVVGVHPDVPDIVVKVIDWRADGFYLFAKAILAGELVGDMYPKIYGINIVDDVAIVLVERLGEAECSTDDLEEANCLRIACWDMWDSYSPAVSDWVKWVQEVGIEYDVRIDLHDQNMMFRDGVQPVLIDPLAGYTERVP